MHYHKMKSLFFSQIYDRRLSSGSINVPNVYMNMKWTQRDDTLYVELPKQRASSTAQHAGYAPCTNLQIESSRSTVSAG